MLALHSPRVSLSTSFYLCGSQTRYSPYMVMKTSLISALLAATAAALPQGLGQISRIVITDAQPTAIAVPRNAEPQHLGPVSRTVIYDSQPTVLSVPRNDVLRVAKRQSIGGICITPYYGYHLLMCHFGVRFADHNRLQQRLVCAGILMHLPRWRLHRVPP